MAGGEADCLPPVAVPWRCCSSGRVLRAQKSPRCSGSPCREGSRCCWRWTGCAGEGAPREEGLSGEASGSVGAAGGGWRPEGWGCSRSASPRNSGAGWERRGAARGRRSPPAASSARTTRPTVAKRAAPTARKTERYSNRAMGKLKTLHLFPQKTPDELHRNALCLQLCGVFILLLQIFKCETFAQALPS